MRLLHWLGARVEYIAAVALAAAVGAGNLSAGAASAGPTLIVVDDGVPDLSGIWQAFSTANDDIEAHHAAPGVPASAGVVRGGPLPYQPWALQKRNQNRVNRASLDPEGQCYLQGVPRLTYTPLPFQIVQTKDQVLLLHEYAHATRTIYTNGTPHPKGPIDWWLGDSRGHWEGRTLVVDSVHFNDQTWLDRSGNFHSEDLHVVERFTPSGPDHIDYAVTVEDPKVFTRPWELSLVLYRRKEANIQLLEYECAGFDVEHYYP